MNNISPAGSAQAPEQTVADLWLKIDQLHLNFIKAEESTRKIDIRKRLEGFVHQYLCLVPQDRKFCSRLVSEIIWQSARWTPNFSAVKAAAAFEAIEKYAANLLNQPWRKEFKEIKQYGGFYKHQVESSLSGAEKMFHAMGYMSTGQETMVLGGPMTNGGGQIPVDQDRVTTVARDCLLAYVECQIAVSVMQGVSAQFPCTWEEVLDFRRDHVGPPEQAVRALVYMKNQLQYQLQHQPASPYGHNSLYGAHSQSPYGSHHSQTTQQQPYGYSNGYRHTNGSVPTANLVDINSPTATTPPIVPDRPKREGQPPPLEQLATWGAPIPLTIKQFEEDQRRKNQSSLDNSWDRMRTELDNSAMTAANQVSGNSMAANHMSEATQLEMLIKKVGPAAARQILQSQAEQQEQLVRQQEQQQLANRQQQHTQRQVSPQKVSNNTGPPTPPPKSSRHSKPLHPPSSAPQAAAAAPAPAAPPALPTKRNRQRVMAAPPPPPEPTRPPDLDNNKWECRACTFLNDNSAKICSICAKSRPGNVSGGHSSPTSLQSPATPSEEYRDAASDEKSFSENEESEGGREDLVQCGKCTLFNDASLRVCEACGASLHIAPIANINNVSSSSSSSRSAPQQSRPKRRSKHK